MSAVIQRGNVVYFSFEFLDEDGAVASVTSATLTLAYPGLSEWQKETLALTQDVDDLWKVTWDSAATRPGWVEYHAHALSGTDEFVRDGRFKVSGNRAGKQHDALTQGTGDYDASIE